MKRATIQTRIAARFFEVHPLLVFLRRCILPTVLVLMLDVEELYRVITASIKTAKSRIDG